MNLHDSDYSSLLRFAFSLTRDIDSARDLTQDTLVKAFISSNQYEEGTNYQAWIFTICKNTFRNGHRKKKREQTLPFSSFERDGVWFADNIASASIADNEPFPDELLNSFNNLSKAQKKIIYMHHVDGIDYAEIAVILGIPFGTVMSRVGRAYNSIRRSLSHIYGQKSKKGFASHSKNELDVELPDINESKTCIKCNVEKKYSEFYTNKKFWDGYHPYCKMCMKDYYHKKKQ